MSIRRVGRSVCADYLKSEQTLAVFPALFSISIRQLFIVIFLNPFLDNEFIDHCNGAMLSLELSETVTQAFK